MKNVSYTKLIMLVLVASVAILAPVLVSGAEMEEVWLEGQIYTTGHYTESFALTGETTRVEFKVENGDVNGEDMVSMVRIVLLDDTDQVREVVISPREFNQREFSNALGTLSADALEGLTEVKFSIVVGGQREGYWHLKDSGYKSKKGDRNHHVVKNHKNYGNREGDGNHKGVIRLTVKEFYESSAPSPPRPSGW